MQPGAFIAGNDSKNLCVMGISTPSAVVLVVCKVDVGRARHLRSTLDAGTVAEAADIALNSEVEIGMQRYRY